MDPITASGIFSIGKELISKATSTLSPSSNVSQSQFRGQLEDSIGPSIATSDPQLMIQKLEEILKSDLLNDPKTANFFQQNQSNQIYLEKRADGSVQFISSNGQDLILEADSPHCSKANELLNLCFDNKLNLTSFRPNAVTFNS